MVKVPTIAIAKRSRKFMEISTVLITAGTLLTAVFTGGAMWLKIQESQVAIIPDECGGFLLSNNSPRTVVVRNFVAKGGTLWTVVGFNSGVAVWGDSGDKSKNIRLHLEPYSEKYMSDGICKLGNRRMVRGKARRVHWHQPWFVDIVLHPGPPIT
jgi:hypothetical protein